MRMVAGKAGLSPGATYYYFRSKDEIALEFYRRNLTTMSAQAEEVSSRTKDFRARLTEMVRFQLVEFEPRRKFLSVLYQNAVNPNSVLSPFGPETTRIRDDSVAVFERLLRGSNAPRREDLEAHLPYLLWLYSLSILLFWIFDESPGRARTHRLLELSIEILWQVLKIQRLPFAGRLLKSVLVLLAEFNFLDASNQSNG